LRLGERKCHEINSQYQLKNTICFHHKGAIVARNNNNNNNNHNHHHHLFQRISVNIQRFNSVLLRDSLADDDRVI